MSVATQNVDPRSPLMSVLIVDDERATAEFFASVLREDGYEITISRSFNDARNALVSKPFNVVIVDIQLDDRDGTALFPIAKKHSPNAEVIFITGHGSIDTAVQAIHEGAFDYLSKPLDLMELREDLKKTVARAMKYHPVSGETMDSILPMNASRTIVGKSPQMVNVYRSIARAALTREHVLIRGESGTGKELVAHALHKKGPWAERPFVTVNCGAIAETLLESELFGHIRGAFTGAISNKKGLFEEANGGTIFLDEIGDISPNLQVKLLRALQEREIKPVGSSESRQVDVRVIAATHRDLFSMVQEGKFREDLYYRLRVITLELPPLRERVQDLDDLMNYFVAKFAQRLGKPNLTLSEEARALLARYAWPGNIREMENAFGRASALAVTNVLFPEDFPPEILSVVQPGTTAPSPVIVPAPVAAPAPTPNYVAAPMPATPPPAAMAPTAPVSAEMPTEPERPKSLEEVEKEYILETLQKVNFNRSRAAEILGIDRVTLYRKASKYGFIDKRRSGNSTSSNEA